MLSVYVDGSYNKEKDLTGSGIVILSEGEVFKKSLRIKTEEGHSWNIDGECHAVVEALRIAVGESDLDGKKFNDKEINIYYDYIGIEKWITREWKAKTKIAKFYYNEVKRLIDEYDLSLSFIKVKSHSKDTYNDLADELAKEACEQY